MDGYSSGTPVAGRLVRHTRTTARKHTRGLESTGRPYSVLLLVGFTMPPPSPGARCALTAPFHPYLPTPKRCKAVCFLWHFPWGRPRRPLTGTVSPWSPDFPRPRRAAAIQPSDAPLSHADYRAVKSASPRNRPAVSSSSTPSIFDGRYRRWKAMRVLVRSSVS